MTIRSALDTVGRLYRKNHNDPRQGTVTYHEIIVSLLSPLCGKNHNDPRQGTVTLANQIVAAAAPEEEPQ